ncbi:MAG: dimethylamine/trimethylamine dehydrogenase [Actinomycetota bacterium]|jgi:hypothetical protein|nr:dimethylamine/trimethylamine dehydrogenase [Actinomycetota bacterium]
MDDEYSTLLFDAYKDELLGEALFGALAARDSGDHAAKLRALQRIEGTTAAQLRPLVSAMGIEVTAADEAAARSQGAEIGDGGVEWDDLMKDLHDALPSYLANFVRLRSIAPDPSDPAMVTLVNHEQAINAFTELELAGCSDRSIAVLQWHLETVS